MCSILIVEDDADGRESLTEILQCAGYDVHSAQNGRQALDHIHHCPPRLIITDMAMPVMDGINLMRELREMEDGAERPKVIAISARRKVLLETARALGADQTYAKPISCFRLLRDVRSLMDNRPLRKMYVAR
ncbi:MAG: response regulator [Acidobacteriota bacterium]|nr:response regulator [Acidobacteriota bacterium]